MIRLFGRNSEPGLDAHHRQLMELNEPPPQVKFPQFDEILTATEQKYGAGFDREFFSRPNMQAGIIGVFLSDVQLQVYQMLNDAHRKTFMRMTLDRTKTDDPAVFFKEMQDIQEVAIALLGGTTYEGIVKKAIANTVNQLITSAKQNA